IRLSVSPSLRYSLLGSLLALMKGKTATEEISFRLVPVRRSQNPAPANTSIKPAAMPANQNRLPPVGVITDPVMGVEGAPTLADGGVEATAVFADCSTMAGACSRVGMMVLRLESVSLLRRWRSVRMSEAC